MPTAYTYLGSIQLPAVGVPTYECLPLSDGTCRGPWLGLLGRRAWRAWRGWFRWLAPSALAPSSLLLELPEGLDCFAEPGTVPKEVGLLKRMTFWCSPCLLSPLTRKTFFLSFPSPTTLPTTHSPSYSSPTFRVDTADCHFHSAEGIEFSLIDLAASETKH